MKTATTVRARRSYVVDVEYGVIRDGEDCGGSVVVVHLRSRRSQVKFVRALEELCSRSADATLDEVVRGARKKT